DNNITNAIKYTLPNEVITLATAVNGATISFEIFSRSKKIENTQKIFEPYYREDGTVDGFGLGLNLVQSICEEEGVTIEIDSGNNMTRFRYIFKVMGT
ncbi:MAG: ATP-binding protein, partial [Thiovulaceae bacterium]|nr:ATP-binding protein [Sulfurimonadaceae bacterium]